MVMLRHVFSRFRKQKIFLYIYIYIYISVWIPLPFILTMYIYITGSYRVKSGKPAASNICADYSGVKLQMLEFDGHKLSYLNDVVPLCIISLHDL